MRKIIAIASILALGVFTACNSGESENTAASQGTAGSGSESVSNKGGNSAAENKTTTSEKSETEKRCGWYDNPTPANHYFFDKDGRWVIGEQGGYQVGDKDFDNIPDFGEKDWVKTNTGSYGYGCACMNVVVDKKAKKILSIKSGEKLPLSKCREDKKLKEPIEDAQESPSVDLVVNEIRSSTDYSTIVSKIGKPNSEKDVGINECTEAKEKKLIYDGLELTIDKGEEDEDYSLLDMKVTSSIWVTDQGIKIGATAEEVMSKYGKTIYADAYESTGEQPRRTGEKFLSYDMKKSPGSVNFYFKNDRLVRIESNPTIC